VRPVRRSPRPEDRLPSRRSGPAGVIDLGRVGWIPTRIEPREAVDAAERPLR
jgi:hypothetical protein